MLILLLGMKVPKDKSSWERTFQGTKVPKDESSTYKTFVGVASFRCLFLVPVNWY